MNKFSQLRNDFSILKQKINNYPLCYLDNASTTQKPEPVLDAMMGFYRSYNANIHRGAHTFAEQATLLYEQARQKVAKFIGAQDQSEIIFTSGATESINCIAHAWGMEHINQNDEIILTELEHHANLLPWQWLAKQKNAQLKFIPVLPNGSLDLTCLNKLITNKTALVSLTHISNALGTQVPLKKIISYARAVGAKVLIDAAQSVPHELINVSALDCDFLVFSGHKMLGPTGTGILYIKRDLHEYFPPYKRGGGMVFEVDWNNATWLSMPQRLEAGTPAIAQAIGLGAAIDYLNNNINFSTLQQYETQLCNRLIGNLNSLPNINILGPKEQAKRHLVNFVIEGIHAHDGAAYCDSKGISVRAGNHCAQPLAKKLGYDASIRASFYFYNTIEEVDWLAETIEELVHTLQPNNKAKIFKAHY